MTDELFLDISSLFRSYCEIRRLQLKKQMEDGKTEEAPGNVLQSVMDQCEAIHGADTMREWVAECGRRGVLT